MKKELLIQRILSVLCMTLISISLFAQSEGKIAGKVVDSKGVALTGASILIKGSNKGTATDKNGNFLIENMPNGTYKIAVSFIGYSSSEFSVTVPQSIPLNIALSEDVNGLEEVIVTGVFDRRTRMESSVAISTLSSKQLERITPTSGIDLLKNMPGVYVNSSRGEVSGSLYTRGLSVGGGFYYVSMQEDGLPIMAAAGSSAADPQFKPDGFLRADITINRVEAVRGGTASILGANAPGGIFNYVSKKGGQTFAGEVRTRFGLEGNGKNPFYRVDLNVGGPLSKDKSITYNVGGFYRYANGPKYPGFPLSYGGQVKANIVKTYKSGSLKLYGKFLNDHTAQFEFTPTVSFTNPTPAGSFTNSSSTLIQNVKFTIPGSNWNRSESTEFDSKAVGQYKDFVVGLNWEQTFGNGWILNNNARISTKYTELNSTAVVFPFRVDQVTFYGVGGNVGRFGTFNFFDPASGKSYGSVQQLPPTGAGQPIRFIANNLSLPGGDVMPNGVLYNPTPYTEINYSEFIDQLTVTKKLDKMSFTAGAYFANSSVTRFTSGPAGQGFSTIEEQPKLVGIKYTNLAGATFDITDKNGITNIGGSGFGTNNAKVNQSAYFFGHNWDISDKLNFDWGLRYELFNINAQFTQPIRNPDNTTGGADGNLSTLYDVRSWKQGVEKSFEKNLNTLSYSAGLNYKINDGLAFYGRYSQGRKSPDLGFFLDVANQQLTSDISAEAQDIKMIEAGLKIKGEKLNLFVTPFYNLISNIPNFQIFQNPDLTYYAPPRAYQKIETKGLEIEANYQINKNFSIRAVGTLQTAKALEYSVYLAKTNGPADDEKVSFDGNDLDNVAPVMVTLTPTYSTDKFYISLNYQYMGARWANVANAFELPAFNTADLNFGYNISNKITLSGSINNVVNTYGIMGWAAPGGFPASLDTQGFTKAMLEANPNTVYSTVSIMPRAYFLNLSYKF